MITLLARNISDKCSISHHLCKTFFYILVLFFFVIGESSAQNWKKIVESLNDPAKAAKTTGTLEKSILDNPDHVLANYCLSVLSRKEGDAGSLFRAWLLIGNADRAISSPVTVPDKITINKALINPTQKISEEKQEVDRQLWQWHLKNSRLELLNWRLPYLENSAFFGEYVALRNKLEYQEALSVNTLEAYSRYLNLFPIAFEAADVIKRKDSLEFETIKAKDLIYSYNEFIARHPGSVVFEEALTLRDQKAFDLVANTVDLNDLDFFIANYPTSKQLDSALHLRQKLAYKKAVAVNTVEGFQQFIHLNQLSNYIPDIIARRDALVFSEVQKFTDCSSYQVFISGLPFAQKALETFLNSFKANNTEYTPNNNRP